MSDNRCHLLIAYIANCITLHHTHTCTFRVQAQVYAIANGDTHPGYTNLVSTCGAIIPYTDHGGCTPYSITTICTYPGAKVTLGKVEAGGRG